MDSDSDIVERQVKIIFCVFFLIVIVCFNKAVIVVKRMIVNSLLLRDSLPIWGLFRFLDFYFLFSAALLLNIPVLIKIFFH